MLIVAAWVLTPFLLIIAPLPGYLLLHKADNGLSLLAGLGAFCGLALVDSLAYWLFWSRDELLYLLSIKEKNKLLIAHWICFIKSSVLFHLFVFAAFIEASVSIHVAFYIPGCYLLLGFVFVGLYQLKMAKINCLPYLLMPKLMAIFKLNYLIFNNGVKLRLLLLAIVLLASYQFKSSNLAAEVTIYYLLPLIVAAFYLLFYLYKLMLINCAIYQGFYLSVSFCLYKKQQATIRQFCLLLLSLIVIVNFLPY